MAESTLSLTWDDLARETAFDLGWQRYATEAEGLSAARAANVVAAVKAGYRFFLAAHDWSFKRPRATFTLWATKTGTLSATTTTATATTAKFFASMIGHELLVDAVVNGTFATDTDWTKGTGWTIGTTGYATKASSAAASDLSQTVAPLISGNTYRVTFTVSATSTAGSITPVCGTQSGTARTASGTYTEDIVANGTGFKFTATGADTTAFVGTVDTVSVEAVLTITAYTSTTVVTVSGNSGTITSRPFTVEANGVYRLPDDYGSMYSKWIQFGAGTNDERRIKLTSETLVVDALQANDNPQRPTMAGIRPLTIGTATGQRFDLVTHPIADQDYLVNFRYEVHPDALTTGNYPYGGAKYAEAMKKCCLAAGEEMFSDAKTNRRTERDLAMRIAIADDSRHNRADSLGMTRNRQQKHTYREHADLIDLSAVTVQGVSYD